MEKERSFENSFDIFLLKLPPLILHRTPHQTLLKTQLHFQIVSYSKVFEVLCSFDLYCMFVIASSSLSLPYLLTHSLIHWKMEKCD